MSHKNVIAASFSKIWLGVDNKKLKLDHDMKNNHFGSLSYYKRLTVSLVLKIGENWSELLRY